MAVAELKKLVKEARNRVAQGNKLAGRMQKRQDKWARKFAASKKARNQAHKAHKPKKEATYQRKMARAKRKVHHFTKREADAIEWKRGWKQALARRRKKLKAAQPQSSGLAAKARSYVGTREGGAQQRAWASKLGYSSYLPWCSIFVANMGEESGTWTRSQQPANPAYSGAWFNWSHGQRVNESAASQPNLIVVLDWGDGGMTDHVAISSGSGRMIGGNQSNMVTEIPIPWGNVVGVIRPT